MEIDNASYRATFKRDFPNGCGPRGNFISSSLVRSFYSCTRDFPFGCGPNSPKCPQICLEKRFGGGENHGFGSNSGVLRHTNVSVKSKPPLGPTSGRVSKGLDIHNLKSNLSRQLGMSGQMMVKSKPPMGPTSGSGRICKGSDTRNLKSNLSRQLGESPTSEKPVLHSKSNNSEVMSKEREKVLEMLKVFRERCEAIVRRGGVKRVDVEANKELTREGKVIAQPSLMFGSIPGVEVGDKFYYRVELRIVGLHRLPQGGIDSMEYGGQRYATCIVANEGHLDKLSDPNVVCYIGEGGTQKPNEIGVPSDQQLKSGNLALNNSRKSKRPVRVVRGLRYGAGNAKIIYVYDGLYEVSDVVKKRGPLGNMIFEFQLTRNPGQSDVQWRRIFV